MGANLLLELLGYARADASLRHACPLLIGTAPNLAAVPAFAATVVGLLLWEAVQPLTAPGVFDWWDVGTTLASGGLLLALHWIFGPR